MFSIDEIMGARAYDLLYAEERDDARTLRWRGKGGKLLKEPVYHRCARYHNYSLFDSQAIDTPAKKSDERKWIHMASHTCQTHLRCGATERTVGIYRRA